MKPGISIVDAAEGYIDDIVTRGLKPGTVKSRKSWVRRFAAFATQVHRERTDNKRAVCKAANLDPTIVAKFFKAGGWSAGNYNNALTAFRGFFGYLVRMRYMDEGYDAWLLGERKRLQEERRPKYYIGPEFFDRILELAGEWHPSDRTILALALYTLARQSEIRDLQLKHLNLDTRTILMRRPKRSRWTEIGITRKLLAELLRWLEWYAAEQGFGSAREMMAKHPDWYLVPRRKHTPVRLPTGRFDTEGHCFHLVPTLPHTHMEKAVKRVLTALGAEGRSSEHTEHLGEGIHTIRRSGARAMFDALSDFYSQDKALLMVSVMLDHENTDQTLLYISRDIERDKLNDWLRDNDPYGDNNPGGDGAEVVTLPIRSPSSAPEALSGVGGHQDIATSLQAL